MKKIITISLLSMLFATTTLVASQQKAKNMPFKMKSPTYALSSIVTQLQKLGYNNFHSIERKRGAFRDHDVFDVECYNSRGHKVEMLFDPQATKARPPKPTKLSMLTAIKKLEALGYGDIYSVKFTLGRYKFKAISKNGRKIKVYFYPKTGHVTPLPTEMTSFSHNQ